MLVWDQICVTEEFVNLHQECSGTSWKSQQEKKKMLKKIFF